MDPVTTVTGAWSIAKVAGDIGKKLYDLGKSLKDREARQRVEEILDEVRELKQSTSELEDENRSLREALRFKKDDFEFKSPFWYEKTHPERPLCPKCFAKQKLGPMGERDWSDAFQKHYRACLACDNSLEAAN
jgi:hypothetical protein